MKNVIFDSTLVFSNTAGELPLRDIYVCSVDQKLKSFKTNFQLEVVVEQGKITTFQQNFPLVVSPSPALYSDFSFCYHIIKGYCLLPERTSLKRVIPLHHNFCNLNPTGSQPHVI
jgi:hypothetical protein